MSNQKFMLGLWTATLCSLIVDVVRMGIESSLLATVVAFCILVPIILGALHISKTLEDK